MIKLRIMTKEKNAVSFFLKSGEIYKLRFYDRGICEIGSLCCIYFFIFLRNVFRIGSSGLLKIFQITVATAPIKQPS